MRFGLPLMKNLLTLLAKSVFIPLQLPTASAKDGATEKNIYESGMTTLIISNKEMEDDMKIVKGLEESGLLIKGVSETIKSEDKEQKGRFLGLLSGTLGVILLGNLLTGKVVIRAGEGTVRGG